MHKIGILALQGDIDKHAQMVTRTGCTPVRVRYVEQLKEIAGLIIPGGESTTIGKLLVRFELLEPLQAAIKGGLPVFGTCAGLILLAKDIENSDQHRLGLLDITVSRNAYGPQVESFEADITVPQFDGEPLRAVFIRAPIITRVGGNVDVLADFEDRPILVREANILGASFHSELTEDIRLHSFFASLL